jgi:hypothetical protein
MFTSVVFTHFRDGSTSFSVLISELSASKP